MRHHPDHPRDVRAGRGTAGGRRDQALQAQLLLPRGAAGREPAQDVSGHGQGHPRGADQAGRPSAQHAHAQVSKAGAAGAHRPRDAGHLRAACPPAGRVHHQVGVGRPRPALHRPGRLLRPGGQGGHAARGAGKTHRLGDAAVAGQPAQDRHQGRDRGKAEALLFHL